MQEDGPLEVLHIHHHFTTPTFLMHYFLDVVLFFLKSENKYSKIFKIIAQKAAKFSFSSLFYFPLFELGPPVNK